MTWLTALIALSPQVVAHFLFQKFLYQPLHPQTEKHSGYVFFGVETSAQHFVEALDSVPPCVGEFRVRVGAQPADAWPRLSPCCQLLGSNIRTCKGSNPCRQGIQVADPSRVVSGHLKGTLARPSVVSFALAPPLGGREVVIDGPDQCRPLQSLSGFATLSV